MKKKYSNVRLSKDVKPERYQITLKPDLKKFTYEGQEVIELLLVKNTKQITLHSKEIEISDVKYLAGKIHYVPSKVYFDVKSETVTFSFKQNLPKGKGSLTLKFKGVLNDKMRGFYRSHYIHEGKKKYLATSQFEATDARQAFPCFDEPAQKAIFDVTLIVPKNLTAISNTIETEVLEHAGGYKAVRFEPTPKMSTYLLAFITGEFENIEGRTKNNVLVRVFVTPGKKHQAEFALKTAIRCLEFYDKYFDIPYPLPVLDLIAIPDFTHGAMENWGAVTYRESALLVDPENSSAANKQWVALVIAHELAHQWFGNLVTMEWWTHLWLNEGFASYMEYVAVHHLFPDWDIWTQFAYNDLGVALKLDSLNNTHAIEVEVHHPDEIGEIFDEVSYSKGASVIRMLADYLGEKCFQQGLQFYLKKHSYKNASTVHLWEAFEKISKKPVKKIMDSWTSKPGYPVVKVSEGSKILRLEQSRFFSSALSKKNNSDHSVWPIPLKLKSSNGHGPAILFNQKQTVIKKPVGDWLKFNPGETGFYRVEYPEKLLLALKTPIFNQKLQAIDRLGIIRDAFALAEAGSLKIIEALELSQSFANEHDYTVWVILASGLDAVSNLIFEQGHYKEYEEFCRNIFSKAAKQVGWHVKKGESHTQILLRNLLLYHAGSYGDTQVISRALDFFNRPKTIPANLRSVVYSLVAENSGSKQHASFFNLYKSSGLSEEKNRIGQALGHFKQPDLLNRTLEFAMSKHVRFQDTASIFAAVWANHCGSDLAWNFTKNNWPEILRRYPSSGHMLNRFIKPASCFKNRQKASDVADFFKKHKAPGADRTLKQVMEKIYSNMDWLNRDGETIGNWLKR